MWRQISRKSLKTEIGFRLHLEDRPPLKCFPLWIPFKEKIIIATEILQGFYPLLAFLKLSIPEQLIFPVISNDKLLVSQQLRKKTTVIYDT